MTLTGSITTASATLFSDPHSQTFLPPGTINKRTTAEHDFEVFAQDSWRLRSNVTVTAGLRWEYETPPWEVNGFEVAPTTDLDKWFFDRVANMNAGKPSYLSPTLSWDIAGRANGKPSWYNSGLQKLRPAPRDCLEPGLSRWSSRKTLRRARKEFDSSGIRDVLRPNRRAHRAG